jgi:hypothetical protein
VSRSTVIFRRQIAAAADSDQVRVSPVKEYKVKLRHSYFAAGRAGSTASSFRPTPVGC